MKIMTLLWRANRITSNNPNRPAHGLTWQRCKFDTLECFCRSLPRLYLPEVCERSDTFDLHWYKLGVENSSTKLSDYRFITWFSIFIKLISDREYGCINKRDIGTAVAFDIGHRTLFATIWLICLWINPMKFECRTIGCWVKILNCLNSSEIVILKVRSRVLIRLISIRLHWCRSINFEVWDILFHLVLEQSDCKLNGFNCSANNRGEVLTLKEKCSKIAGLWNRIPRWISFGVYKSTGLTYRYQIPFLWSLYQSIWSVRNFEDLSRFRCLETVNEVIKNTTIALRTSWK
jgi:hypothetical protein